ncbi:26S proteasome regulatory particle [Suhomyces tanzawaensis NRRL Y-17324]|uniref:26S proteasome regulatory particle n=1 Tax=Suhomyces tanzawaensis NRRL Y-17324 TaxID=984487 RepID=A0A1E4SCK8_9ASCO|nr:26S proteasome regulatory particle [Suhomyces tanzawaensis NRRL Y-17324]ODV77132.1 26S proteasome regulatory particle [Suhomyces tanzawaensis NRRL Y-17324]
MSAMDVDYDASTVLATLRLETESGDLINLIYQLEDYYERKLWHQLTLALDELYHSEEASADLKFKIYRSFVNQFSSKLNPIKVVDFLLESYHSQPQETLDNLLELKEQYIKELKRANNYKAGDDEASLQSLVKSDESVAYVSLQIARYKLLLNKVSEAEEILDELKDLFGATGDEGHNFENPKINSAYYLAKCELYKINENYNLFYSNGLLYLSSVDNNLSEAQKVKLCYELCIAALLGDKIYNFGELILHDILNAIKDESSQYNWLYHLIQNLNSGNLTQFNHWLATAFKKSPFLTKFDVFLKQKIIIMSLLELISLKSTTNKQLTLQEISSFTGTSINDVEHLIIKCFSLNLIKGYINQIDEILVVTWLQPRILNLDQVNVLYKHLLSWDDQVETLAKNVYKNGGSVWAGI